MLVVASAMLGAASCVTPEPEPDPCDGERCVALGETFVAGEASITPLEVLEDSRCPIEAECIDEGNLRVHVRVERGGRAREVEIDWHQPVPVWSGNLVLTQVWPDNSVETMPLPPAAYRFAFDWTAIMLDEPSATGPL